MPEMPPTPAPAPNKPPKKEGPSVIARLFVNYYGPMFLLIAAMFLIIGFALLQPRLEAFKELRAQAASTQEHLDSERAYLDSLQRSIAAAQTIPEETLADVEEALPSEPGIPELLEGLSTIAETYRVQLSNIQFSTPRDDVSVESTASRGTPVQSIEVSMNLSSPSYAATRRYLDAIERNLRLFDVQTISVAPGQGETGQVYTIQLRTYMLTPSTRP